MPLNPFAREYVPGVGKQISLLNVSSVASPVTNTHLPTSPEPDLALSKDGTQPVGSSRCPTPAAEALEVEELQFEDVFEAEAGPPSPRSHLSPVSPGGLSMVRALQQHQQTTALICWICSQSYLFLLVCSHQVVQVPPSAVVIFIQSVAGVSLLVSWFYSRVTSALSIATF